jgi:trehalose/maltose transport system substrate-binding protein
MMLPNPATVAAILLICVLIPPSEAATLTIVCGSRSQALQLCQEGSRNWAEQTGHEVRVVAAPSSNSRRLELYRQFLEVGAGDIDVLEIDVVWPGLLASQLVDLQTLPDVPETDHFPALLRNNTVDDRLVALPWYTNVGRLFYRRDLLEKHRQPVPSDWDELQGIALQIQDAERRAGNNQFWGFVWEGQAGEGLSSSALEWIASHGGGSVVEPDGRISVNNPRSVAALRRAESWLGDISPPGVLELTGDDSLAWFKRGDALFLRHWSGASMALDAEDSQVSGLYGSVPLPSGGTDGRRTGTLGGWQLAVSRHSEHPAEAAALVAYLTGAEEQRRRVLDAGFNPTRPALYSDPSLLEQRPELGGLHLSLINAVARPSAATGQHYVEVSRAFQDTVRMVLEGQANPALALSRLERQLQRLSRNGTNWRLGDPP